MFHFFYILPNPREHVVNSNIVLKVRLKYFGLLTVFTILVIPAYADQIVEPTDKRTINIGFSTDPTNPKPGDQTQLKVSFINKQNTIQQHIDYKVSVTQGGNQIFGIPLTHTAEGSVSIPFQFQNNGTYQVTVEVDGILFQPIPPETASFTVDVVPEFPLSTAAVLAVSVVSIIVISSRSRLKFLKVT